jgi:hypothetical protein
MKSRIFLILCFALGLFASCEEAKLNPEQKELVGDWTWVSSSGGIGGIVINAKTTETVVASFKKNGVFELTENGQQKIKTTYEVKERESILTPETKTLIYYGNGQMVTQSFDVKMNTLYLNDEVFDGLGHTYTKTN